MLMELATQILGQDYSRQREQTVQGRKAEACLTCVQENKREVSVVEAGRAKGRVRENVSEISGRAERADTCRLLLSP